MYLIYYEHASNSTATLVNKQVQHKLLSNNITDENPYLFIKMFNYFFFSNIESIILKT